MGPTCDQNLDQATTNIPPKKGRALFLEFKYLGHIPKIKEKLIPSHAHHINKQTN